MTTADLVLTDAPRSPITSLITDPSLLSILTTTSAARTAALDLLDLTSSSSLSTSPSDTTHALALSRAQKPLYTHLALLRSHNRTLAHTVRSSKATTATSRGEVDTLHLSLQNLHYESRHLAGEIAAAEGFPHTYTKLPLVGEEEFLVTRGEWRRGIGRVRGEVEMEEEDGGVEVEGEESMAENGEEKYTEENLMHARIDAEMQERQRLEEVRKGLVARKMELVRENAKRKEELGKLDSELEAFIDAAKPIQKTFEKEW